MLGGSFTTNLLRVCAHLLSSELHGIAELIPIRATTLYSFDVICMMNLEPLASHRNRISKTVLRSNISRVHFRDVVCWVLWVTFPFLLMLIHSKVSTLGIENCLGMFDNILKSFEPILPSLWHSGFTWLQPGL